MFEIIQEQLRRDGIEWYRIDGQTPPPERLRLVHQFNNGGAPIFLISLKAGGTGLNLTGADTVIHYDPWWNPAAEDQATDRAYRIGQTNTVQVFKIVTHGTIEEKIFVLKQQKKELVEVVIQPGADFLTRMTLAEIQGLFAD
ncbi:MAG TPA: C-terminal helicase domain-containing protein, partial [Bacillota bacterium]